MKRAALYSSFILSAIAASFFTSDFDIQTIHRILSTNADSIDGLSTPSSAQNKVRRASKDADKGASLTQSKKNPKASSENKRSLITEEEENGSSRSRVGALSGEESEPDGLHKASMTSSKLKRSVLSKSEGSITDLDITSSKKTRIESKGIPSHQQSENPEDEVLQTSMDPLDEGNLPRKDRSGSLSTKKQTREVSNTKILVHSENNEGTDVLSRDMMITSPENGNSKGSLGIKNEKEKTYGNTQEFRRDSRAMSHEAKEESSDQLTDNETKESISSKSEGSTKRMTSVENEDIDMKNSKEFRRGGRAMSQDEQSLGDEVSSEEGGSLKTETTKKNSKSLTNVLSTDTEVGESSENSVSEESNQSHSVNKPRISSKSESSQVEKDTKSDPDDENAGNPSDNKSTQGKKVASKSVEKSPQGDEEGSESVSGSVSVADSSDVQPRRAKAEQGIKGLRGGEGATNMINKDGKKSVQV